jgi:hypothetical protein
VSRPLRVLLNTATVLSLVLLSAAAASWVWSHWRDAWVGYRVLDGRSAVVAAERGWVTVSVCGRRRPGRPPREHCFPPTPGGGWLVAVRPLDPPWLSAGTTDDGRLEPWWRPVRLTARAGSPGHSDMWDLTVRHWLVAVAVGLLPACRAAAGVRKAARLGTCPACGYDLRATPERCPECGTIPA